MRTVTALHPGFIRQEMTRALTDPRYQEAAEVLHEWAHVDPTGLLEPPGSVKQALASLQDMKLEAFAEAGRLYRRALERWDNRAELAKRVVEAGLPSPSFAHPVIDYEDPGPEPIFINFGFPA